MNEEIKSKEELEQEVISLAALLSEKEKVEMNLTEEEIENPTEETLTKIQEHFQAKNNPETSN